MQWEGWPTPPLYYLSPSDFFYYPAPSLFLPIVWRKPKTLIDTSKTTVQWVVILPWSLRGHSWQRNRIWGWWYLWRRGSPSLKRVVYYRGKNWLLLIPNILSSLCSIQLILSHISVKEISFYISSKVCDCLYSISSLSSPSASLSCIMYSVMELKYFRALLMSLDPFSTSRALFKIILIYNVSQSGLIYWYQATLSLWR